MKTAIGRLYLVATPRPMMSDGEFLDRIDAALAGGVDVLQLRCKNADASAYLRLAEKVMQLARAAHVPFIINDRPDVALACGADGVHLGQDDLPVEWGRRVLPDGIIGRSSHEPAHAERAVVEGASYFAVGPVWETPTKPGRSAAGLSYVRHVAAQQVSIPWFAIGGITLDNVERVLASGARRIAVVRAILDAPDPAKAARDLALAIERHTVAQEAGMRVNGELRPYYAGLTLPRLLADLAVDARRVVVMHGDTIYRGGEIPEVKVEDQDVIEIVTMMQGG